MRLFVFTVLFTSIGLADSKIPIQRILQTDEPGGVASKEFKGHVIRKENGGLEIYAETGYLLGGDTVTLPPATERHLKALLQSSSSMVALQSEIEGWWKLARIMRYEPDLFPLLVVVDSKFQFQSAVISLSGLQFTSDPAQGVASVGERLWLNAIETLYPVEHFSGENSPQHWVTRIRMDSPGAEVRLVLTHPETARVALGQDVKVAERSRFSARATREIELDWRLLYFSTRQNPPNFGLTVGTVPHYQVSDEAKGMRLFSWTSEWVPGHVRSVIPWLRQQRGITRENTALWPTSGCLAELLKTPKPKSPTDT